jgi:mannose-6-phosphate isomerase-like protein (cupin superfamily)
MTTLLRRVVTGLDENGRSCIAIDDAAPRLIWANETSPADNGDPAGQGGGQMRLELPAGAAEFLWIEVPPGQSAPLHATNTLDYIVILSGEATIVTETGEAKLRPGDVLVDRGVLHAWRNDGAEPYRAVGVMIPAHPVGAGADVSRLMPA